MPARSLARRLARAGALSSGRVCGAVLATLFFFLLPVTANAYTLVLRGGRHVTVPDDFKVTPTAVVYEASPGLSIPIRLTNIDVAATEKANAEPAGSFARRIKRGTAEGVAAQTPGPVKTNRRDGSKVITNKELEPSRLRREAQEAEYERTRRQRGMPSREELRQYFEEQDRRLHESALRAEAERAEAVLESVRSELVEVKQNLYELSLRLSQQTGANIPVYVSPNYYPYYYAPPAQVITRFPFGRHGSFGRGSFGFHPRGRAWHYNPWQGRPFPSPRGAPLYRSIPPRAPAMPAPRR